MKSDNGPAFKSQEWFALLAAWWITPLLSPPYAPWYNGSCERGIGAMKIRTSFFAARYGRLGYWTRADLDDAERQANRLHRPEHRPNATAQQVWDARAAIGDQMRTAFDQALLSHRAAIAKRGFRSNSSHEDASTRGRSGRSECCGRTAQRGSRPLRRLALAPGIGMGDLPVGNGPRTGAERTPAESIPPCPRKNRCHGISRNLPAAQCL